MTDRDTSTIALGELCADPMNPRRWRRKEAAGDIEAAKAEHEAASRAIELLKAYSHEPEDPPPPRTDAEIIAEMMRNGIVSNSEFLRALRG